MNDTELDLQALLDEVNDLVQSVAPDGTLRYVNQAWRETLGYGENEISHLNIFDIIRPDGRTHFAEILRRVLNGEKLHAVEIDLVAKNGKIIKIEGNADCAYRGGLPFAAYGVFQDVAERRKTVQELRRSEDLFEAFMNHSPVVAFMKDDLGRYVYANETLEKMFQIKPSALLGLSDFEWLPQSVAESVWEIDQLVISSQKSVELMETVPTPDGAAKYWMVFKFPFNDANEKKYVGGVGINVTAQKEAEEKLYRSEQHFRHLVEDSQGFLCTHDRDGRILSVNPAAAQSLGYSNAEMTDRNLREFIAPELHEIFHRYLKQVWKNKSDSGTMIISTKDGEQRVWKYHNVKLTESIEEPFVLGYAQDITELKETEKQLRSLSLTDDLTGLYNRRGFLTLAERQMRAARLSPHRKNNYLVFADMDGLKIINDTFGHEYGSLALAELSSILAGNFRGSDIIARLGGDEFVVLMVDADEESTEIVLDRLQGKIGNFNNRKNYPFDLSLSVGITRIDLDNTDSLEEILAEADRRMYEQKRNRKAGSETVERSADEAVL